MHDKFTEMKRWSLCLVCCSLGSGVVLAQVNPDTEPQLKLLSPLVVRAAGSPKAALSKTRSSLDQFQQLLSMSPEQREQTLAGKSEKQRAFLRREIQKYESMPPEEREMQLQGLRTWYYVRELVQYPKEIRQE